MNNNRRGTFALACGILIGTNVIVWFWVFGGQSNVNATRIDVLDVGQGDSQLLTLSGGVQILTDAGEGSNVVGALEHAAGSADRYIDLAIVSHPQLDHFDGFNALISRYRIGAFIYNGRGADIPAWKKLLANLQEKGIPIIDVGAGDRIRHGANVIHIILPDASHLQSAELNDTSIVKLIETPHLRALFTGDIDALTEEQLLQKLNAGVDVLKVAHHGSKYSSSAAFLGALSPKIAVIGVGERNRYGHPTPETLKRLASSGAALFRTDVNGTVTVIGKEGKLRVFVEKP
jgi:competence protein ComEC